MKKIISAILILFFVIPGFTLEVDVDEIKSKKVNFINYKGRNKQIDPVSGIYSIGTKLANGAIKKGPNYLFRYHMKYSIYRATGPEEPDKLSADIVSINREARVDHIKNVRRIISAYLMRIYNYNKNEADSIALFTIYYNAIHRGDISYLSKRYKTRILKRINKRNAGIARKYTNWPGKTKIIIPLTDEKKRDRIVDPFVIGDKETRKQARKDRSKITERKKLLELKKEKITKDKKKLTALKKTTKKEDKKILKIEKEIKEKEKKITKKKQDIEKKKKELKKEKKQVRQIKDISRREARKKKIAVEESKLKKEEKKLKKDEKILSKDKSRLDKKKEQLKNKERTVKAKQKEIEKKEIDIKEDRKEIRDDEIKKAIEKEPSRARKELIKKENELKKKEETLDKREDKIKDTAKEKNIYANMLYYLKIKKYLEGGHYNNEMCMINPATRKIEFKSPEKNICGRRYDIFSGGIVVVTHQGSHTSGHRLTMLDRKTLKPIKKGKENIFWRSFIEIRDNFIYSILYDNGSYYLGKFDTNLKLIAKSGKQINENTFITFYGDYIYINAKNKQIMVLNKKSLAIIDTITP